MERWAICTMLKALLMHVEHNYHTSDDACGTQYALVEAMRAYVARYQNEE